MPIPSTTSLTLLGRLKENDSAAWQRLVDVYGPFLHGRLRKRGLSDADSEEVLQEIFARIAKSIGDFRKEKPSDKFLHWLQTITSNQLTDYLRRENRHVNAIGGSSIAVRFEQIADPLADEDWSTDSSVHQNILARILKLLKTDFEEPTWRSFWMFAIDGKSTEEISKELGMTGGAIRQARSKVRRRLAEEFCELIEPTAHSPLT